VPRSAATFRDAWYVLLCDLHLRKERPTQDKYNAAQQVSYTAIVVMGIFSVLTGLAIYKPAQLSWLAALFGGYPWARFIHFVLTIGYCVFFVVHVIQVVLAGWNNLRSMVIGYEVGQDHE
jgi:thiosulfate reductase cytochrome b subunit